jgi:hypothetical protein
VGLVALLPLFSMKGGSFMGKIDWDVVTNFTDAVTTTLKTVTFPKVQEQVYLRNQGNANFTYTIGSQSGTLTPGQSVTVNQDVSSFTLQAVSGTHTFELRAKEKGTEIEEVPSDVPSQIASLTSSLAQKASQTDVTNAVSPKADKSYVDTQVQALANGSPKGVFATLVALQADSNANTTDGRKSIYLVSADGKWYYWNGSAWTAGGLYQGADVPALIEYESVTLYQNIAGVFSGNNALYVSSPFTKTINADGSFTITGTPTVDTWMQIYYKVPFNWLTGHSYFASFKMLLDAAGTQQTNGDMTFNQLDPRYNNTPISTKTAKTSTLTVGSTKDIIYQFDINTALDTIVTVTGSVNQNCIMIQPIKVTAGNTVTITIKDLVIQDMGLTNNLTMPYADAYSRFTKYGYTQQFVNNYTNLIAKKVDSALGLTTINEVETLIGFESDKVFENIAGVFSNNNVGYYTFTGKTVNGDGSVTFTISPSVDTWAYVYLNVPFHWLNGHSYFVALGVSLDAANQLTDGNLTISSFNPRYNNTVIGTDNSKDKIIAVGNTLDNIISQFDISTALDTSATVSGSANQNCVFLQPIKVTAGKTLTITIKKMLIVDMGLTSSPTLTYNDVFNLFTQYGYAQEVIIDYTDLKARKAVQADVALVAKALENAPGSHDIEVWGDSLVEQNYASNIASITGRTCTAHGYGGRTSTYIRDMFLQNANKDNSMIINVGRNNYTYTDRVVYDIRKMVEALPHNRFIICCPPNGNYWNEFLGTENNHYFSDLEARLQKEYPNNFVNTRLASIYGYNMGGVTLNAAFTQPAINGTVQINVSDANFLASSNDYYPADQVSKIRIGANLSTMDLYQIMTVDSATLLTVKLLQSNRGIAQGGTVNNIPDEVEPTSFIKLQILQEADYQTWLKETTHASYRKDNIHMSPTGLQHLATVCVRAINTIGI